MDVKTLFNQLFNENKGIGLSFNVEKTAVLAFNFKETNGPIFLSLAKAESAPFSKISLPCNAYRKKYERNCKIIPLKLEEKTENYLCFNCI